MPTCWIIAGPNGAGKTTFALEYLLKTANCSRFINADMIASGLSPLAPERELLKASRLFLAEIENCITQQKDFAFETTLAGRSYLKLIQRLHQQGWSIELIYMALPSVAMSKLRVAERVAHGGHNIPTVDIERRFARSLYNLFHLFSAQVNVCKCFMNSNQIPVLIFEQQGDQRIVENKTFYDQLLKEIQA
jgi:predicted ABC-type ATPase